MRLAAEWLNPCYCLFFLQLVGKTGKVVCVDGDGDVKVEIGAKRWLFNPQCCELTEAGQKRASTLMGNQSSMNDDSDSSSDNDDDDDDDNDSDVGNS